MTKEQANAAKDALNIIDGSCNGKAISRALVRAYDAWKNTDESNKSAPVKLMLYQLSHLAEVYTKLSLKEYLEIVEECEQMVKEYEQSCETVLGTFSECDKTPNS